MPFTWPLRSSRRCWIVLCAPGEGNWDKLTALPADAGLDQLGLRGTDSRAGPDDAASSDAVLGAVFKQRDRPPTGSRRRASRSGPRTGGSLARRTGDGDVRPRKRRHKWAGSVTVTHPSSGETPRVHRARGAVVIGRGVAGRRANRRSHPGHPRPRPQRRRDRRLRAAVFWSPGQRPRPPRREAGREAAGGRPSTWEVVFGVMTR